MTLRSGMTSASRSLAPRERCRSRVLAISFNLDAIIADKVLPARAVETLIFFAYPLAGSLLVLTPGLFHTTLGIGLAILAAGLLGLVLRIDLPRWQHERDDPLTWRVGHAVPGSLLATLAVIAALAMIVSSVGGLYWLGGAMAVASKRRPHQQLGSPRRDQALNRARPDLT